MVLSIASPWAEYEELKQRVQPDHISDASGPAVQEAVACPSLQHSIRCPRPKSGRPGLVGSVRRAGPKPGEIRRQFTRLFFREKWTRGGPNPLFTAGHCMPCMHEGTTCPCRCQAAKSGRAPTLGGTRLRGRIPHVGQNWCSPLSPSAATRRSGWVSGSLARAQTPEGLTRHNQRLTKSTLSQRFGSPPVFYLPH